MKKKLQDTDIHIPPGNKGELSRAELWQILNGMRNLSLPSKSRKNPLSSVVMSQIII
jgi:hypothetical protein